MNHSLFAELIAEQHKAIVTLETAMEQLFFTEKALISNNALVPDTTRSHTRDAALELVQLVVDRKLKDLAEEAPPPGDAAEAERARLFR